MRKILATIISVVLIAMFEVSAAAQPFGMSDVSENHSARYAVTYVVSNKIFAGYGDYNFRGDRLITRYETAVDAYKLVMTVSPNAVPASYDYKFSDVPKGHWAYPAVRTLAYFGGMGEGYGDGTFRGDRLLTRYEAAVLFCQLNNFLRNNPQY